MKRKRISQATALLLSLILFVSLLPLNVLAAEESEQEEMEQIEEIAPEAEESTEEYVVGSAELLPVGEDASGTDASVPDGDAITDELPMALFALPMLTALPPEEGCVRVIVENTVFSAEDGAAWDGILLDENVELTDEDTMMSCIRRAVEDNGYTIAGADSNYISAIEGLAEFDGGTGSGWTGTLNGWYTNEGFQAFSAANGKLRIGDEIRVMYTVGGAVLEGVGEKTLSSLAVSAGTLSPAFDKDEFDYTLTLPRSTESILLTPVATDKRFQVWSFVGDTRYSVTELIPVAEGTEIEVRCGDPSWPCMYPTDTEAKVYTVKVTLSAKTEVLVTAGESGGLLKLGNGAAARLEVTAEGDTVRDVIEALHEQYVGEGSCAITEDGTVTTFWNKTVSKLSCRVNGAAADTGTRVRPGDHVELCLVGGQENYAFFNAEEITVREGESVSLLLSQMTSSGTSPCASAALTVNGEAAPVSTGTDGKVVLSFEKAGTYVVSAYKTVRQGARVVQTITPPVCIVTVQPRVSSLSALRIARTSDMSGDSVLLRMPEDETEAPAFDTAVTSYDLGEVSDAVAGLYFAAQPGRAGESVTLTCGSTDKDITVTDGGVKSVRFLQGGENIFSIHAGSGESTAYSFTLRSVPTLLSLTVKAGEKELSLDKSFAPETESYTLTVPEGADTLTFTANPRSTDYTVTYNGGGSPEADIRFADAVTVTVSSKDGKCCRSYVLTLDRQAEENLRVETEPADALVRITDPYGESVIADENGVFYGFFSAQEYSYTVQRYGYVTKTGKVPTEGGTLKVTLEKAEAGAGETVEVQWKNFRNSDNNMAITAIPLPSAEDAESVALKWNRKLGDGWESAPSVQIIVDGSLIVMGGTKIYKLDRETGETVASGDMVASPNWGYTPPSCAEGMIFCPLNGGTIQAFDAKTLKSLWVYRDPLGGQALSPITCADGYLYTGFWNGETKDARYVCLNVTDEDPSSETESKEAVWAVKHKGGFYWAGSVVIGNAVIVGGEDGVSGGGDSTLYSIDRFSGRIISAVKLPGMGDQRASIAWDVGAGRVYFTVQDGYFCSVAVNQSTGELGDLQSSSFEGQSTSTPIIYKGRAYYGVGSGVSEQGSTGAVVVADAETMRELYRIPLRGYPQGSLLLSTAHESKGVLCLYATYNNKPGGISLIVIDPEATSADSAQLIELYDAAGYEEYCISSLICDESGTLFYKNDSGNIFAVGIPRSGNVIALIEAIGEAVTIESESTVASARAAYDALEESEKAKVSNYSKLLEAEKTMAEILARIDVAEKLINAIGTPDGTETSRKKIEAAHSAMDALSEAERSRVENAAALQSAERTQQKYDHAHSVEALINGIGTVENTDACRKRIEKARKAFDELLGTEKALVSNYSELTAAERKLESLKTTQTAGGTTRALNGTGTTAGVGKTAVTISGVTYTVDKAAAELMQRIEKLTKAGAETADEDWVDAYKTYAAMTEGEKSQIFNYDDLEAGLNAVGANYHRVEALGAEVKDLPWNVKLELLPVSDNRLAEMGRAVEQGGSRMLRLYTLRLTDILTGEEYESTEPVEILMAAPANVDLEQYASLYMAHRDENGRLIYDECDVQGGELLWDTRSSGLFALCGGRTEAEAELPEEEILPPEDTEMPREEQKTSHAGLLLLIPAAAVLLGVLWLKRKADQQEEI